MLIPNKLILYPNWEDAIFLHINIKIPKAIFGIDKKTIPLTPT